MPHQVSDPSSSRLAPSAWPIQPPDAVFFGTFNPITLAHTHLMEMAHAQWGFERLWVIPALASPFKHTDPDMAPYTDRLAMAELACKEFPWTIVSPMESWVNRPNQPSYSSTMIQALQNRYTDLPSPLPFIIGIDALMHLPNWHQPETLILRCEFLIASRPNFPAMPEVLEPLKAQWPTLRWQAIPTDLMDIASSQVREDVKQAKKPLPQLLDELHPDVWAYIQSHQLYP